MQEKETAPSFETGLSKDALHRLVISFILHAQDRLRKKGLIQPDQALGGMVLRKSPSDIDAIEITEDMLGFDSLAMLDLILTLNRFFDLSRSGVEDYLLIQRRIGDWVALLSEHRRIVGDKWTFGFETSGSTGDAKLISYQAQDLWAEMAAQIAEPLAHVTPPARVLTLVPPHHIYGFLFGCVLPDLLGLEVIDLHRAGPGAAFREAQSGDLVIGTPFNWELLGKAGHSFADGVHGVTSAGPSNPKTWGVIAQNNLHHMTEIYGATETGGIGWRTSHDAPFNLLTHLVRADERLLHSTNGRLLDVQDRLAWQEADRFHVCGRLDHVVQVAGVNISPKYVREALTQLPGVAEALVRHHQDRLHAYIIPADNVAESDLSVQLQRHIAAVLAPAARPASLTFGPELPRNAMGKTTDWLL